MVNRRKGENKSMKKLMIIALAAVSAATMYAQGTVRMVSKNPVTYGPYMCGYLGVPEGTKVGSELNAYLIYENQVMAVQPFAMNSDGTPSGLVKGDVVVTPLPAGTVVSDLTVQAFSWEHFLPFWLYESAPFSYTTGDPADPTKQPDSVLNFESFIVECPEPTTIALGILGLGSLLVLRRRD